MSIEIREDSQYTFTYEKIRSDLAQLITSATISIYNPDGEAMLEDGEMTIVSNVATYNMDLSIDLNDLSFDLGTNYRVEYLVDGELITYFFDVVMFPFVNPVNDQDLIKENPIVKTGITEERGRADSGTVDTIVDTERTEPNEYWYGGLLEIMPLADTDQITKHQITDYDQPTNTITFDPPRSTAVTTESYILRRSYQDQIDLAGEKVSEDLAKNDKRIYLLIDSTQCKRLVIYKFFETYFQSKRKGENDEWDLQFRYYADKYKSELSSLKFDYDEDEDGSIDDEEKNQDNFVAEIVR